ncbi:hypothetical protein IEQ34_005701 [Dendrobium chrysotoxum]|uniref:E3 UFM1-protein ligase-like C-terminal domain-containing protein n=1 Tax=Dendrobium chrysotoxum TaxID=161865 RepID=A0AAV7HC56_DENCH|nr:hypothetical protein IEQ34_005701 [Dendrobium chrysotoxum]
MDVFSITSISTSIPDDLIDMNTIAWQHVGAFIAAFQDLAEESGLPLKKLDNKLEKSLLQSYGKAIIDMTLKSFERLQNGKRMLQGAGDLFTKKLRREDEGGCDCERDCSASSPSGDLFTEATANLEVSNRVGICPPLAVRGSAFDCWWVTGKLPEETFKVLMDYHKAIVTLLALQSAATEDKLGKKQGIHSTQNTRGPV